MIGVAAALAVAAWVLPARSQDRAGELMQQTVGATKKLKVLQADVEMRNGAQVQRGAITLKRPNLARIDMKASGSLIVSDGKSVFSYMIAANEYQKGKADPDGANVQDLWALMFFQPDRLFKLFGSTPPTHAGTQKADGADYEVLEIAATPDTKVRFFVSPRDFLIYRMEQITGMGAEEVKQTATMKNVRTNGTVADAFFKWTPPKTAKMFEAPDFEKSLIAVGKKAPDFDLDRPEGGRLALSSVLKEKKATLVNFWFYG
ncbi:MAG: resA 10 [Armatimonadetes bacterium]|jgi:outer membrane lipoprotein-sorting protein|nr:resA 10 [Armatimonadota bacterium]